MSGSDSGFGIVAGVALGDHLNQMDRAVAAARSLGNKQALINVLEEHNQELQLRLSEWRNCVTHLFDCQARTKADFEGLKTVVREIASAIRQAAPNNAFADKAHRSKIFGAAHDMAEEEHASNLFSQQIAERAGMLALIDAGAKELQALNPSHVLNIEEERYIAYWIANEAAWNKYNFQEFHSTMTPIDLRKKLTSRDWPRQMFKPDPRYYEKLSDETIAKKSESRKSIKRS